MMTKTKIVCTIGPSVATYEKMVALMEAGMDVARLNFSHGTQEEHEKNIRLLKKARDAVGRPVALMLDTQGPEIRLGKVKNDAISITPKQRLKLASEGDGLSTIPLHPVEVLDSLHKGTKVLFDDGYLIAEVVERGHQFVVIEMQNSGTLKTGKKMNVPGAHLSIPAMSPKDILDLQFGCSQDIDLVAASFIRSAQHVLSIKEFLAKQGKPNILVIAKIESTEGIDQFDSIVQAADGIMIARGDLGVELDLALVPKLQKMMIRKCFQTSKPSITATQMLESMITNPRPTRAEVSDVANAIYDATSCIMLSGETAVGKYPIETVQQMRQIAREAEEDFDYRAFFETHSQRDYHDLSSAVAMAAVKTAYGANAKAIFAFTATGATARLVSRFRPEMPIIAVTDNPSTYYQLALNWGVVPVLCPGCTNVKELFAIASAHAITKGLISFGDVVVVATGTQFGKKGATNTMMLESIGDILVRGHKGIGPKVTANVEILLAAEGCDSKVLKGKLVVIRHCDKSFLLVLQEAAGIILQNAIGDSASESFAITIAKTYGLSVITRADGALSLLDQGEEVTLDPAKGLVYRGSDEVAPYFHR